MKKTGRNDYCPCGSGKKFKNCHLDKDNPPDLGSLLQLKGTRAEKHLHQLADKTFLADWCYPNATPEEDKRELCDLLVLFGDTAVIWQVKNVKTRNGSLKESDIEKNQSQLAGAARRLLDEKRPITLENPRRGKEVIDASKIKKVHLVSLLSDAPGSFERYPRVRGRNIHVFDKSDTEILLTHLDTIADFTEYLEEKENLFSEKETSLIRAGGEADLLALYFRNKHSFSDLKGKKVVVDEGIWDQFVADGFIERKEKANEVSRGWDQLIESAHGTGTPKYEAVARELAKLNRMDRRLLSETMVEAWYKAADLPPKMMHRRAFIHGDVVYCFLFAGENTPADSQMRMKMLDLMGRIARARHGKRLIIGIGSQKVPAPVVPYDYYMLEAPELTEEDRKKLIKISEETGILASKGTKTKRTVYEFPLDQDKKKK